MKITKAQVIPTRNIVHVKYIGFDNDGYSIYRDVYTGIEYHEIELDFNYVDSSNIVVNILNLFL